MASATVKYLIVIAGLTAFVTEGQTNPNAIAALNARITNVERTFRQLINAQSQQINILTNQYNAQASTLAEISRDNEELRRQNAELQTMLGTFERFFGSLLVDNPESFDPNRGVVERMDSLNAFLGNRAAMIAGLNPDPPVVPSNHTVDQEELGRVLTQLSEVNSDLEQKVNKLERRVDSGTEPAGDRGLSGGTDDIFTLGDCHQSITKLTAQLNAVTATTLEKDNADRLTGDRNVISDRDREILEGAVYGDRGVASTRKSAFSVAATRATIGETGAKTVEFDYVITDKGNNWNATSNSFVCAITGYYFFTFSLRSYDDHYMGVTMMKNDGILTSMYTERSERNVMESQAVVVLMEIGDRVWLRLGPSTQFAVYSDAYKYATFSGFLVYKGK